MHKVPLVSVHMITYNHAPYIAQAIEGVLSQTTDFPYELVIGEDCSTDETRKIVYQYAARYPEVIRVVASEHNVGARMNSRRTTAACRGKYIAWCEGDDTWHRTDKLQLQGEYLEAHDDCVMVHSDFDYYDEASGKRIPSYYHHRGIVPSPGAGLSGLLAGRWDVRTCTACARIAAVRDVYDSDPEVYATEKFLLGDAPLWADLFHRGRLHYIDESLATYNVLAESMSHSGNVVKQQQFFTSAVEVCLYYARKYGLSQSEVAHYEARFVDSQLFLAFLTTDRDAGQAAWGQIPKPTLRQKTLFWGLQSKFRNRSAKVLWYVKRKTRSLLSTE